MKLTLVLLLTAAVLAALVVLAPVISALARAGYTLAKTQINAALRIWGK